MKNTMKKLISFITSIIIFMSSLGVSAVNNNEDTAETNANEPVTIVKSGAEQAADSVIEDAIEKNGLIIKYKPQKGRRLKKQKANEGISEHIDSMEVRDSFELNGAEVELVDITSSDIHGALQDLNANDNIEYAEPNFAIKTNDEPYFEYQWGLRNTGQTIQESAGVEGVDIDVSGAWNYTTGNSDVLVAVIDTGIYIKHNDLSSNIYVNPSETSDGQDNDGNGYIDDINGWDFTTYTDPQNNGDNSVYDNKTIDGEDADLHGTHVAGIIAAEINDYGTAGVAPGVKILPVKVLDGDEGTVFHAIKGIEYAETMGAQIANCSWGVGAYVRSLEDCIKNSNMLFVCAAGNDACDINEYPSYPASYSLDNVISVTSIDNNGILSYFSNYGGSVSVAAPGGEIYSTLPVNKHGYLSGTSMAAPFVTGAAALLKSVSKGLSASDIKVRIEASVTKQDNLKNITTSGGMVNARKALETTVVPSNLTVGEYGAGYAVSSGELYTVGGCSGYGIYSNDILRYNASADLWEKKSELPVSAARSAVVESNGIIYSIGGISSGKAVNAVFEYNTQTERCIEKASLPKAMHSMGAAVLNGCIYLFGGVTDSGYTEEAYKYDISSDTWSKICDLPQNIGYCESIVLNDRIYIIGGANENGCLDNTYEYKTDNDSYISWQPLNIPRRDACAVIYNGKIILFGGSGSYTATGEDEIVSAPNKLIHTEALIDGIEEFNTQTNSWKLVDSSSYNAMGMGAVNYNGSIYFAGGWNGQINNTVEKYFGISVPVNLSIKTDEQTAMDISWNQVTDADKYELQIDNDTYTVNTNKYTKTIEAGSEHKIRVRAVRYNNLTQKNIYSMWSGYKYYYPNNNMFDAKLIELNSVTNDKLYQKEHVRWYKLNTGVYGLLSLSLTNIPEGCSYSMQLCNSAGMPVAYSVSADTGKAIDDFVISRYNYYVKVYSDGETAPDSEYTLTAVFTATADTAVDNDRIKASILQPSSMSENPGEAVIFNNINDISESELPEYDTDVEESTYIKADDMFSTVGKGGELQAPEVETEYSNDAIQTDASSREMKHKHSGTLTISSSGGTTEKTISTFKPITPGYVANLIVEVEPENKNDIFKLEWSGVNTNYSNFYHFTISYDNGMKRYYLVARLTSDSVIGGFKYKITFEKKSSESNGKVKYYEYCIQGKDMEDFHNTRNGMVNDLPVFAEEISVSSTALTVTGSIDHLYDKDFYKIKVNDGEKLTAVLKSPKGIHYDVAFYNVYGTEYEYESSQFMDGWYMFDSESQRYISNASCVSTANRYYCLAVYDDLAHEGFVQDNVLNNTYTLTIYKQSSNMVGDLELNDEFEHADKQYDNFTNNYLGGSNKTAKEISFTIDNPVDIDRYKVELNAGDKISAYMKLDSSYVDSIYQYRLEVHEPPVSGTYMCYSYNNPNSPYDKSITFVAKKAGIYYVAVRSLSEKFSNSIKGTLRITKTLASDLDEYEVRNEQYSNDFVRTDVFELGGMVFYVEPSAIKLTDISQSKNISANFDNELDTDWYKIEVGDETIVPTIGIKEANNYTISPYQIYLLDSSYNIIYTGTKALCCEFQKKGVYYVGVCVQDGKYKDIMSNRGYTLSFSDESVIFDVNTSNDGDIKPAQAFNISFKTRLPKGEYTVKVEMGWGESQLYDKGNNQKIKIEDDNKIYGFSTNSMILQNSGEHLVIVVSICNSGGNVVCSDYIIIESVSLNGYLKPQEIKFERYENSHKYIYIDEPEHIRNHDTINCENPVSLMNLKNLSPGTYTLCSYHHKAIKSVVDLGYMNDGEQFSPTDSLYYNIMFYNTDNNTGNIKVTKLGCGSFGNSGWDGYHNLWSDFTGDDAADKLKPGDLTYTYKNINKLYNVTSDFSLWLSDLIYKGSILISDVDNSGYVWVMMEFEVTDGSISLAELASSDPDDYANRNFTKYTVNGVPEMRFDDKPQQVIKGMGDFSQQIDAEPLEYIIDDSIPVGTALPFLVRNKFTDGLQQTNTFVTNSNPLYPDVKKIFPESAVMDIKLDLPDQTMIFDGYHSPFIGSAYLPEPARIGPYVGKEYFSTNESFDSEWMKALPTQYGHEVYNEDDTGISLNRLIGETTMQGYGVTNKYTISIYNAGHSIRKLIYQFGDGIDSKLDEQYSVKIIDADRQNSEYVNLLDEDNAQFTVNLPEGSWKTIEIYVSQWAGSSATLRNKFTIE